MNICTDCSIVEKKSSEKMRGVKIHIWFRYGYHLREDLGTSRVRRNRRPTETSQIIKAGPAGVCFGETPNLMNLMLAQKTLIKNLAWGNYLWYITIWSSITLKSCENNQRVSAIHRPLHQCYQPRKINVKESHNTK